MERVKQRSPARIGLLILVLVFAALALASGDQLVVASYLWLIISPIVWVALAAITSVVAWRARERAEPSTSRASWRPSVGDSQGLSAFALYLAAVLTVLGAATVLSVSALFKADLALMTRALVLLEDILSALLLFIYIRLIVLVNRGAGRRPGLVLAGAYLATVAGVIVVYLVIQSQLFVGPPPWRIVF